MFLNETKEIDINRLSRDSGNNSDDVLGYLFESMELNEIWFNLNQKLIRVEHYAIVNEDIKLLQEVEDSWWDKIVEWFKARWESLKKFITGIWNWIKATIYNDKDFFDDAMKQLKNMGSKEVEIEHIKEPELEKKLDEAQRFLNTVTGYSIDKTPIKLRTGGTTSNKDMSIGAMNLEKNRREDVKNNPNPNLKDEEYEKEDNTENLQDKDKIEKITQEYEKTKEIIQTDFEKKDLKLNNTQIQMMITNLRNFSNNGKMRKSFESAMKEQKKMLDDATKLKGGENKAVHAYLGQLQKISGYIGSIMTLTIQRIQTYIRLNRQAIYKFISGKDENETIQ